MSASQEREDEGLKYLDFEEADAPPAYQKLPSFERRPFGFWNLFGMAAIGLTLFMGFLTLALGVRDEIRAVWSLFR